MPVLRALERFCARSCTAPLELESESTPFKLWLALQSLFDFDRVCASGVLFSTMQQTVAATSVSVGTTSDGDLCLLSMDEGGCRGSPSLLKRLMESLDLQNH